MDLSLLPAADEIVRCADHARRLAVDPGGSAITADVLIAVEVPLPWPKPVFDHPLLEAVAGLADQAAVPTRILAAVPLDPAATDHGVISYRRRGGSMVRTEVRVDAADIADAVRSAMAMPQDPAAESGDPGPELWVCAQGSHDSCCGGDGTRLAMDVAGMGAGIVVRRVSHTGGHRFAPTALTLPDGRMWGYADPELVGHVIDRTGEAAEVAMRCRGWTGAAGGYAQMAERAVFATVGWSLDDAQRTLTEIERAGPDDDATGLVEVRATWADGSTVGYRVEVAVLRQVPTIACREPGGLPAKPGREFGVTRIERIA